MDASQQNNLGHCHDRGQEAQDVDGGGSDSHFAETVGLGVTEIEAEDAEGESMRHKLHH